MSEQSSFTRLINGLEQQFHVVFQTQNETQGKIYALEDARKKNLELIDREFSDVIVLIESKLPYIRSLEELNQSIEAELDKLRAAAISVSA